MVSDIYDHPVQGSTAFQGDIWNAQKKRKQ